MSKRTWRAIKTIGILIILLIITFWVYAYLNNDNWKTKLLDFIKGEGLMWIGGTLFVVIIFMILKRIFRIRF